jgi:crotonobetainyl-CoA:carnitine CoA-transferase CaiB-like acyl-CoA transferase
MVLRRRARAGVDVPMTGVVPRFSRTPGSVRDVGPSLGEHDAVVRAELALGG